MTDAQDKALADDSASDAEKFQKDIKEAKGEPVEAPGTDARAKGKDLAEQQGGNPEATPTPSTPNPLDPVNPPLPGSAGGQADKVTAHNPPSSADLNAGRDLLKAAEEQGGPVSAAGVVNAEDQPSGQLPSEATDEDKAEAKAKAEDEAAEAKAKDEEAAEAKAKAKAK